MIKVSHLTKSYGPKKGVFDLSFEVKKGEVFGFIGPNGAGKTTTIRHLLGFIKPDEGFTEINDLNTLKDAATIQEFLGYLPGEMAFFDHMTGHEFLELMSSLRNMKDHQKKDELLAFFELDPNARIRKMSKGMKQKLGLIAAFMHDPEVLILDEPTSGLDPLMQTKFVELILQEKKRGKTILMSSHSFEEIERTCDRAGIIKDGQLVALEDIQKLKKEQRKVFVIRTKQKDTKGFDVKNFDVVSQRDHEIEIAISGDIMPLIKYLATIDIESLSMKSQNLEEIFMMYYQKEASK